MTSWVLSEDVGSAEGLAEGLGDSGLPEGVADCVSADGLRAAPGSSRFSVPGALAALPAFAALPASVRGRSTVSPAVSVPALAGDALEGPGAGDLVADKPAVAAGSGAFARSAAPGAGCFSAAPFDGGAFFSDGSLGSLGSLF
ncbi:hypothetical protein KQY30_10915 [Streptomyces sp. GMY02]|uniref:hypothetical protein n=1 Tax=Streptomyces sp. GMY02 TaxID=1333528 RepID=UPI001C2C1769|nr:hypothetical protein [Streptomyces sp. GMY02]QXE34721.1 hypothetical protein KQY30_10915 [Streptomyces sp. GMY02]